MAKRTKKEQQQRSARQKVISICVLVVILVNGALGYWLYGILVLDAQQERLQALTRQHAQEQAQQLSQYLRERQDRLEALAAEEATLLVLQPEDLAERTQRENEIAEQYEHSLAARLIPRGQAQLDREHEARIGFAELELIRRAEQRQNHYPEMARVENEGQLHFISPVPPEGDEPPRGTVLVTLADTLHQHLNGPPPQLGLTRLRQQIPGSGSLTFLQRGQGDAGPEHSTEIANSHWQLTFIASEQLVNQSRELPTLWLLILSATSVGGLILAWVTGGLLSRRSTRVPVPAALEAIAKTGAGTEESEKPMPSTLYQDQDILDLEVDQGGDDILEVSQAKAHTDSAHTASAKVATQVPALPEGIFRSYDIRGVADSELTPELANHIGRALGSEALDQGETHILLARDGRVHSPVLAEALRKGLVSTGCQVIDLGVLPTPILYFATHHLAETRSGVMVTASHNPAEYNGFKMVINGTTLADEAVLNIRSRIERQQYHQGEGHTQHREIVDAYIERISSDVALMGSVSLVVDAGNAVTGPIAPGLFEELGCEVTSLYCDLDGQFPNHDPDPTQETNLQDLIAKVQEVEADLGVAFDGDGDRLVVVTPQGRIIWPDQLLMLFARDILSRNPGADVLFDVKCSRQLSQLITSYGGRPIMWKTGHSQMKSKMVETGALIGGEYSGHIFIKDRWYGFDDGLYSLARLLEIITLREQPIDDIFAAFAVMPSTPELKIAVPDNEKFALVERVIAEGDFHNGKATTIDGLRVDFGKGWGLVRASNTSAALTLRFEAESQEALKKIQQLFKRELLKVNNTLNFDF